MLDHDEDHNTVVLITLEEVMGTAAELTHQLFCSTLTCIVMLRCSLHCSRLLARQLSSQIDAVLNRDVDNGAEVLITLQRVMCTMAELTNDSVLDLDTDHETKVQITLRG